MAVKKPLVMGPNGLPQQLQTGDTLSNVSGSNQITQTSTPSLVPGNVVYNTATADTVAKAVASGVSTSVILGLAQASVSAGATGSIQTSGVLALTTTQWDAVAGTTGGLVAGTTYFLSPSTAGNITSTVPTTVGQTVAIVGTALSTTELNITPTQPILL